MFDIGFSELIVIALVALIVIGPERLPRVARTAGVLLGRLQRYVSDVKADISREIQLDELKRLQREMEESARALERSIDKEVAAVEAGVGDSLKELQASVAGDKPASVEPAAAPPATSGRPVAAVAPPPAAPPDAAPTADASARKSA
jgi:sec-independent protein translocase protein TatB